MDRGDSGARPSVEEVVLEVERPLMALASGGGVGGPARACN